MELLTRKEVAQYLKVGLSSVDNLINNRDFNGKIKVGNRVLIDKEDLDSYIKKSKNKI